MTNIVANVDGGTEGRPSIVGVRYEAVRRCLSLATGSNVKLLDLDEDNKSKANVVARGIVVSLVGGTLHGRVIEEGNASVCISSIELGAESVLLYEGNNDNDPPMVRLDDALKSITKWPIEALQAIPTEPQQAS